jgi:hypothetical protein
MRTSLPLLPTSVSALVEALVRGDARRLDLEIRLVVVVAPDEDVVASRFFEVRRVARARRGRPRGPPR